MVDGLLNVAIIAKENTSLRFLRTLESIRNQDYSSIRLLVVDANEQNNIYSLGLQEDLSLYQEVEYLNFDESFSIGKIRNLLLDYLDGEYITFLNDNDIWDVNTALFHINNLKSNPSAGASCANGILIDERKPGNPVEPLKEEMIWDTKMWVLDNPVRMSAQVVYKRETLMIAGGFDEQFISLIDADMVLRLSKNNKVIVSPVSLCECRLTSRDHDYEYKLYSDFRKFKLKHINYFITNRRLTQKYYGHMIKLSIVNCMWLTMLMYALIYFIKGPIRTIKQIIEKVFSLLYYGFRYVRRELSINKERLRISKNILLLIRGKGYKKKAIKSLASFNKEDWLKLSFSSAKHYNEQKTLKYIFNKKLKSLIIPNHVTVIKKGMFYACKNLVSIEIPNTVVEIQNHAFQNCINLRNVKFQPGSRLNRIGDYAFAGCTMLEELNLPSSVTQFGAYGFSECFSLNRLTFTNSSLFPTSIETLPRYVFAACKSLSSVEFEANSILSKIEKGAFLGCSNLLKILFTGRVKYFGAYALASCKAIETIAFLQIDSLEVIGKSAFKYCESLPYFQIPSGLDRIRARTFYACSKLKFIKIPKKVLSINHQAFKKCSSLTEVVILNGDIIISATAFDNHTKIEIQENVNIARD